MSNENGLPEYNVAAGQASLSMAPPFSFPGVTMRVFPLRANAHRLTDFCNRYLNIVPEEVGVFRPAMPFVIFAMINYGKLTPAATNAGWVSQNEVVFTVPLEWYEKKSGKFVFKDWASVTPYVFVDSQTSMITGREVYGWPKVHARLKAEIDAWTRSPRQRRRVMTLETMLFDHLFEGERQQMRTLIEVDKDAAPTLSRILPQWKNPLNALFSGPRALRGAMTLGADLLQMGLRSPLQGYRPPGGKWSLPGSASARGEMVRKILRMVQPFAPDLSNQTINLKQFRDAAQHKEIAYQALTCSPMRAERINGGGFLGDLNLLRGNPSGGFRIRMHRGEAQPIVDTLGLEVAETRAEGDGRVDVLYPVMPCWLDMDMSYEGGKTLAWQTQRTNWTWGDRTSKKACDKTFNTTRSAALQVVPGPHQFRDATVRVLPLLADRETLKKFCKQYLMDGKEHLGDKADFLSFEAYGSYVYMVSTRYAGQASDTMNVGEFMGESVKFYVPVLVKRCKKGSTDDKEKDKELVSLGMVAPFGYADSNLAAISEREINGFTTVQADMTGPPGGWPADSLPADETQVLLGVSTDVLPALDVGQEVQRSELFRIIRGAPPSLPDSAVTKWRAVEDDWGPVLRKAWWAKVLLATRGRPKGTHLNNVRALALELLVPDERGCAFNEFALKQFRDSEHPERACFQAIVQTGHAVGALHDLQEMEEQMHIGISRYPSQDIVKTLGLLVKREDTSGAQPVRWLEPQRPFRLELCFRTEQPRQLATRAGSSPVWRRPDDTAGAHPWYFDAPRDSPTRVGEGLVKKLDGDLKAIVREYESYRKPPDPSVGPEDGRDQETLELRSKAAIKLRSQILKERQNLVDAKRTWLEDARKRRAGRMSVGDAATSIRSQKEPQAAIEALLSKEWGNRGGTRMFHRFDTARQEYEDSAGYAAEGFREAIDELKKKQGQAGVDWATMPSIAALRSMLPKAPGLEELFATADAQKPLFYIRADALGPRTEAFRAKHELIREDGCLHKVRRGVRLAHYMIRRVLEKLENGPAKQAPAKRKKKAAAKRKKTARR